MSGFLHRSRTTESFGIVADWTQALNVKGDLTGVLENLMRLIKADAAIISRISISDKKTRYVARCDAEAGKIWSTPPRSHAAQLLENVLPTAKKGSIWTLSDLKSCDYPEMQFGKETIPERLFEVIMAPLEMRDGHADILELHFRIQPAQQDLDLITVLIGTLSTSWNRRVSGFVANRMSKKRNYACVNDEGVSDIPILDVENPAGLSRSEYRVCFLLKEGMTVNVIAKNLSICPATVRAHLSSVFSKTGTCSQVELLHQLHRQKTTLADVANG